MRENFIGFAPSMREFEHVDTVFFAQTTLSRLLGSTDFHSFLAKQHNCIFPNIFSRAESAKQLSPRQAKRRLG